MAGSSGSPNNDLDLLGVIRVLTEQGVTIQEDCFMRAARGQLERELGPPNQADKGSLNMNLTVRTLASWLKTRFV